MRVHLLKADDCDEASFQRLVTLLQAQRGPITYVPSHTCLPDHLAEEREWPDAEEMATQKEMVYHSYKRKESAIKYSFPFLEREYTWEQLFDRARAYRIRHALPAAEPVILLTASANELNWFGAADNDMRHFFVQTSHWPLFMGEIDARFPVAYEVQCWLMRKLMFPTFREMVEAGHKEARGCMMDFCREKRDVVLKMRTGDLCGDCLHLLEEARAPRPEVQQLFEGIDAIRSHMLFRERYAFFNRPSRLRVSADQGRLYLSDLGDLELPLNPKERSLLHFFLRMDPDRPLPLTALADHRAALRQIYLELSPRLRLDSIDATLDRLTDPLGDDFMQNASRIRSKLKTLLGESMAIHYCIARQNGGGYSVRLDRSLVDWE